MYRVISFLIMLFLVSSVHAQDIGYEQKLSQFQEMSSFLQDACVDQNGVYQSSLILTFDDSSRPLDCGFELNRLEKIYGDLTEDELFLSTGEQCTEPVDSGHLIAGLEDAIKGAPLENDKQCLENNDNCMNDLYCNAFKSFIPGGEKLTSGLYQAASFLYHKLDLNVEDSSALPILKKCAESPNATCLRSILRGVFDSVFTSLETIWDFTASAAKKGWSWLKSKFQDAEDKSSEQLLMASQMNDSFLDRFLDDPLGMIQEMAKGLYDLSMEAIKTHYGCEQWQGEPMASKCLRPMEDWGCADCSQKMNAICGVLGFAGGEIITSFLTGGMVGAAKVGVTSALKVGVQGLSKMKPLIAPLKRAVNIGGAVSQRAIARVSSSALVSRLSLLGKQGQQVVSNVASSPVVKAAVFVPRMAGKGVSQYFSLMDQAFVSGMNRGEKLASLAIPSKGITGASELAKILETAPDLKKVRETYPDTFDYYLQSEKIKKELPAFVAKATPEELKLLAQFFEKSSLQKLPADRVKWRQKLGDFLKNCR